MDRRNFLKLWVTAWLSASPLNHVLSQEREDVSEEVGNILSSVSIEEMENSFNESLKYISEQDLNDFIWFFWIKTHQKYYEKVVEIQLANKLWVDGVIWSKTLPFVFQKYIDEIKWDKFKITKLSSYGQERVTSYWEFLENFEGKEYKWFNNPLNDLYYSRKSEAIENDIVTKADFVEDWLEPYVKSDIGKDSLSFVESMQSPDIIPFSAWKNTIYIKKAWEKHAFLYYGTDGALEIASRTSLGKIHNDWWQYTKKYSWQIIEWTKISDKTSGIYESAAMPFAVNVDGFWIYIHAWRTTGEPESHGCIRLPLNVAQRFYNLVEDKAKIYLYDNWEGS